MQHVCCEMSDHRFCNCTVDFYSFIFYNMDVQFYNNFNGFVVSKFIRILTAD